MPPDSCGGYFKNTNHWGDLGPHSTRPRFRGRGVPQKKDYFGCKTKDLSIYIRVCLACVSLKPSMPDGRFDGIMVGIYFEMIDKMKQEFDAKLVDLNEQLTIHIALLFWLQKRDEGREVKFAEIDATLARLLKKDADNEATLARLTEKDVQRDINELADIARIDALIVSLEKKNAERDVRFAENDASLARLVKMAEESDALFVFLEKKDAQSKALIVSLRKEIRKEKKRAAKIQRVASKPMASG